MSGGSTGFVVNKEREIAVRVDSTDPNNIYVGSSLVGTATSSADWQIKKLVLTGTTDVAVLHAGGTTEYKHVWDDRASLSYS